MSKGKIKKHKIPHLIKAIRPPTLLSNQPPQQEAYKQLIETIRKNILDIVEKRVRAAELKAQMIVSKLTEKIEIIQANQIVLQGMLGRKEFYTSEEFQTAFEDYVVNKLGVVEDGCMKGIVNVDMFNIGVKLQPTSAVMSHSGKSPIFVN